MKLTTKNITLISVLAAIYVVLSLLTIETNTFKGSFESLAVLMGAFLLGPFPAFLVGAIGEFVHQLLSYGLDPTTVLWLLPYALEGLIAGFVSFKNKGEIPKTKLTLGIIVGEVLLTLLVTPVIAVSAIIQGWGNWITILPGIPLRLLAMVIRIILFIFVVPVLYKNLKKVCD